MKPIELFENMLSQQRNGDPTKQNWFSQAEWYCAHAYRSTQKIGAEIMTFKDPLRGNLLREISDVLVRQRVPEVILGAKDPDILLHLLELQNLGWRIKQMCLMPVSPFEATHALSSPAIALHYSPDSEVDTNLSAHNDHEKAIYITAVDLVSSAILERLKMRKRSWVSIATLEKYAEKVQEWWKQKGHIDVRTQISEEDINDVLVRYSAFFERFYVRAGSGSDEVYIARKECVSEEALRNRFCASLPIVYLTALSESWQELQKNKEKT